ncbi:glycosyltransferase family 2 protein [Cryobacterium sp. N22]|uniref:glycosyltransferase family 2 protein n=1 Tax=Cryobacterium sp. N22 TaxID=2048290 RepID=UPI0013049858|nr:glycosyltransferase family 2 protein [Cryobacterium sp. N22]
MRSPSDGPGSFIRGHQPADVAVVIVTYNSAADIGSLLASLRVSATAVGMRVIVVDNDSTDDTLGVLSAHGDVTVVSAGGNRGYAGGINVALRHLGPARSILVLNPDLVVWPGSVEGMLASQASTGAGIVVPRLVDSRGNPQASLRREPSVLRSFGEALFGDHATWRPAWLAETVYDPDSYSSAHPIEWATGAALLIHRGLADRLGDWDERYFLYSEETDYFRRAREAGATARFTPVATVEHRQGGSGMSPGQAALLSVNRVRYAQRHGSRAAAAWVHLAVTLHAALRARRKADRHTLGILLDRRRWASLPHATVSGVVTAGPSE